jgi:hypothetical protein
MSYVAVARGIPLSLMGDLTWVAALAALHFCFLVLGPRLPPVAHPTRLGSATGTLTRRYSTPMRLRKLSSVGLAFGVAMLATQLSAAPPARTTQFGWADGDSAHVRIEVEGRRRTVSGQVTNYKRVSQFDLTVTREGANLKLRRSGPPPPPDVALAPIDKSGRVLPRVSEVQAVLDDLPDLIPTTIVSVEGQFQGIDDTADALEHLDGALTRSGLPKDLTDRTRELGSRSLEPRAREGWQQWVGLWIGRPEQGHSVERRQAPFPGMDITIDLNVTNQWDTVPCERPRTACVRFEVKSTADEKAVARALEESGITSTRGIRSLSLDSTLTAVVEASTLLPHRIATTRDVTIQHAPGSDSAIAEDHSTKSWHFSWK